MKAQAQGLWRFLLLTFIALMAAGVVLRFAASRLFGVDELTPPPSVQLKAETLFYLGPVPVTNALLSAWLASLLSLAMAFLAATRLGSVGRFLRGAQDMALEYLVQVMRTVAGERWSWGTASFVGTLFLFIVANAWTAILPFYGPVTVQLGEGTAPLLRGAGTDINMPLALALLSGAYVEIHAFQAKGWTYLKEMLPIQDLFRRRPLAALGEAYLATLECLTRVARLLSFTFRLFGTMTAGELLLLTASFLTPLALSVPFYGLELLLGLLQAVVFSLLTLVFVVLGEEKSTRGQPQ